MATRDDRVAALRARVYGREPDAGAIAELRLLLAAPEADADPLVFERAVPARRRLRARAVPGRARAVAAALLSAALLVGVVLPRDDAAPAVDARRVPVTHEVVLDDAGIARAADRNPRQEWLPRAGDAGLLASLNTDSDLTGRLALLAEPILGDSGSTSWVFFTEDCDACS